MKKACVLFMMTLCIPMAYSTSGYGEKHCMEANFFCMTIQPGQTWKTLFPDNASRDLVKRINRTNKRLREGMILAVPKNIERLSIYDVSPFPRFIASWGEKTIYVSREKLAWAAYNEDGELLWWGPISSGAEECSHVFGGCTTPTGYYRIIRKQDMDCISTAFPRRADGNSGGAEMPYCMHFFRGYALHGSADLPGYHASHGCIRLFIEDARWLNKEFVELPGIGLKGTRVIIQ